MRLLYLRLVNYIGVYNGRADNVLEVDLSNSTSNLVIIRGPNGSGKSTLLKALSPLMDDSASFIPGMEAKKLLRYLFKGEIYEIEYTHTVKTDGSRGPTKLQIYRGSNREPLNPTMNVSSGKEIIYSLFNLDTNFLTLTQLSSEDRGLADKKPYERKKFVNSIISGIEVYNNFYKTITKKHSACKSMISSLSSKISRLGNTEELHAKLVQINGQIEKITADRDKLILEIAKIASKIDILSGESNIDAYYTIKKEIEDLRASCKEDINIVLDMYQNSVEYKDFGDFFITVSNNIDRYQNELLNLEKAKSKLDAELEHLNKSNNELFLKKSSLAKELEAMNISDISESDISIYNESMSKLDELNEALKDSRFNSSKEVDSMINAIDMIYKAIESILNNLDHTTRDEQLRFINIFISGGLVFKDISKSISKEIEERLRRIADLDAEIKFNKALSDKASSIALRPKECKIDSCGFIKDALEAYNAKPDEAIDNCMAIKKDIQLELDELSSRLNEQADYKELANRLTHLIGVIKSYRPLFEDSIVDYLLDETNILSIVKDRTLLYNDLNECRGLYNLITMREMYKGNVDRLGKSVTEYNKNKDTIIRTTEELESTSSRISDVAKEIENCKSEISNVDTKLYVVENKLKISKNSLVILTTTKDKITKYKSLEKDISKYDDIVVQISSLVEEHGILTDQANNVNEDLNRHISERDSIMSSRTLLEEYTRDIEYYRENYDKLDVIKHYVSPTTGIQTVFMGTYMNSIIVKANELLSLIFNGQFIIQPFVINESEFRIPCLGNGLINDDISSMSTSQICMISMILSFAILSNSSTDYNILKLDEIDGGLDTMNRIQFIGLLKQLISIVGCEQCFLISHNIEYDENTTIIDMGAKPVVIGG